jgi:hypothetical protein
MEMYERFADGEVPRGTVMEARKQIPSTDWELDASTNLESPFAAVRSAISDSIRYICHNEFYFSLKLRIAEDKEGALALAESDERVKRQEAELERATLVRCIFRNPFRPVAFDPRWFTSTVIDLSRAAYEERAWERLPILADALMDAGCDDEQVLDHCRGPGPHARGCWVVDAILRKG